MIDEFEPTNFVSTYHRYDTPDIITTKNQIEYGLKKAKLVSGWSSHWPKIKFIISRRENLWFGKSGSITKAIAQNLSVVRSSSFDIYFHSPSSISFDERRNVRRIAKITATCAYPESTKTQTKYVRNETNSEAGERALSLKTLYI